MLSSAEKSAQHPIMLHFVDGPDTHSAGPSRVGIRRTASLVSGLPRTRAQRAQGCGPAADLEVLSLSPVPNVRAARGVSELSRLNRTPNGTGKARRVGGHGEGLRAPPLTPSARGQVAYKLPEPPLKPYLARQMTAFSPFVGLRISACVSNPDTEAARRP